MGKVRAALVKRLWRQLPEAEHRGLQAAVSVAERRNTDLYLVGGAVRDLLLKLPVVDIDLVVEDDAIAVAGALGKRLGAKVVVHRRFGTAVVKGEGLRLDLARARTELYKVPGALPTVRPAMLGDDLGRRDFTINAMALRLSGPRTGELIDLHGGERDLAAARVRILHHESFQDDATRIFRALRYAGRLGFQIERSTALCLRRDRSYIDAISGTRVRRELERIAVEERVGEIVRLAFRHGVLDVVHPVLGNDGTGRKATRELTTLAISHRDSVLLCLLLAGAAATDIEGVTGRLALTGRQAKAVSGVVALQSLLAELGRPGLKASRAVELLGPHPVEAVEAIALLSSRRVAARARSYLEELRFVRPVLRGSDLERLGIGSGPKVGLMLRALLAAKLDSEVRTRDDEVTFVERVMKEERGKRRG